MNGYFIGVIWGSWALGKWHRPSKVIYALGPLRFVKHRNLGPWRE